MINNYIGLPLSRVDLKYIANQIKGIDIKKKKPKLLSFTLAEIKQLLFLNGYKLKEHRYFNNNKHKCMTYYIITDKD